MNVAQLRADTPGCADHIHLNNAGAGLMPLPVIEAITGHLELEARLGGYEAKDARGDELAACYADMATLLGCRADQVAFTENATVSYAQALSSVPFERGDVLVTTRNDYVSNQIQFLSLRDRFGIEVVRAAELPEGGFDALDLERLVRERRPRLVSVTHVPTNSGLVQDVEAAGRVCREHEVPYLLDACQTIGQLPLDFEALGCDFLSATTRKFLRGPRGCGVLAVSDRVHERGWVPLFPDLRGADWVDGDRFVPHRDARLFENWEFAYALVLGTGAAARYAQEVGVAATGERIAALATRLREGLAELPGASVLDLGARRCGIVTVAFDGQAPEALMHRLREAKVHTSWHERIDATIDIDAKGIESSLRLSPHAYNTEEELDRALEILGAMIG